MVDPITPSVCLRIRRFPVLVCLAVGACGGGTALSSQDQTAITQMERALDAVRRSQEAYYGRNGVYTTDPARLDIPDVPGQAELVLQYATASSYLAWATHPSTDWICFLSQPANRPFDTRCVPPEQASTIEADSTSLDLARPAG